MPARAAALVVSDLSAGFSGFALFMSDLCPFLYFELPYLGSKLALCGC